MGKLTGIWWTHTGGGTFTAHFWLGHGPTTGDKSICGRKKFGYSGFPSGSMDPMSKCNYCERMLEKAK